MIVIFAPRTYDRQDTRLMVIQKLSFQFGFVTDRKGCGCSFVKNMDT